MNQAAGFFDFLKGKAMSIVTVVTFEDERKAEKAYQELIDLELEYLVDLEDAVVIRKQKNGKIKYFHEWHTWDTSDEGALGGGIWGSLLGLLVGGPFGFLIGGAGGALVGGVAGSLVDFQFDKKFIEGVSESLKPGSSAIFALVRYPDVEKVLDELDKLGGKLHATTLTEENERYLRNRMHHRRSA